MKQPKISWKNIKTAPKDGSFILIAEPHPGGTDIPWLVHVARWIECPQFEEVQECFQTKTKPAVFPGWYMAYPAIYSGTSLGPSWVCKPIVDIQATHWSPLPLPPTVNPTRAKRTLKGYS